MFTVTSGYPVYEISHKYVPVPCKEDYVKHIHPFCEMILFLHGEVRYHVDGILYTPHPYDLLLIPKGTYHYVIPHASAPYENFVVDFHPDVMHPAIQKVLFSTQQVINIGTDPEFCRFFTRLDDYSAFCSAEDFADMALCVLRELLIYAAYRIPALEKADSEHNRLLDEILRYIAEHLAEPINADVLSQALMLSKSYIQNVFSQTMHIGLKQYILQKKVLAAQKDLCAGMKISAACVKYGFADYSGFYRVYKKVFGYAPGRTPGRERHCDRDRTEET